MGAKVGWLRLYAVAQWQRTSGLSHIPVLGYRWWHLCFVPCNSIAVLKFHGQWRPDYILIRHHLYWSSDHREVATLFAVILLLITYRSHTRVCTLSGVQREMAHCCIDSLHACVPPSYSWTIFAVFKVPDPIVNLFSKYLGKRAEYPSMMGNKR